MEKISEIAKIVTEFEVKKIDTLYSTHIIAENQYTAITMSLANNEISTDDEVAKVIKAQKKSDRFRTFKKRLREKLLNSLLFIELDEENARPYIRAIKTCDRNCYCINILMFLSASHAGADLAEITLKKALEFELYDTALFCAKVLRKQQGYHGNQKEFDHYNALVEQYHALCYATDKAAEYLETLNVSQANTNILKPDNIKKALELTVKAKELFDKFHTYQVGLHYYRVKAFYESMVQDYFAAMNTWQEFEGFIGNYKSYEYRLRLGESALQQLYCHLCLTDYVSGQVSATKCETLFNLHSNNWFIYKEYYFLLCMHTRNYEMAGETVLQITNTTHFKFLNRNRQEKWKIFEAYNYLVHKASNSIITDKKFRISSFLNETLIYNKDKEGFNISILIFQVILLMLEGNFGKMSDKIESLKRYANRYFIKDAEYKSQVFIKMLLIADKCGYNKVATIQKTQKYLDKIQSGKYTHVNSYDGLEIAPYTHLWEIVLAHLIHN